MSGILDSKSRVIDTIITTEGRRQLALGGIDIQYVSFTDNATFYKADIASGSQDATARVYLEACQLPQDQITFQSDDSGNVNSFDNSQGVAASAGRILDYSFNASTSSIGGSLQGVTTLTGNAFATQADNLLASSADNFRKIQVIATKDPLFEEDGFAAGPDDITFTIQDGRPIRDPGKYMTHISALDSIFNDIRFSNQLNFDFLPPCNKIADQSTDKSDHRQTQPWFLAYYMPWGGSQVFGRLEYSTLMGELQYYARLGYNRTINFDPTSTNNTLTGQFLEKNYGSLRKLDIVDFGRHNTGNPAFPVAHIFLIGKIEVDEKGTDTFLHIFTLVFQ